MKTNENSFDKAINVFSNRFSFKHNAWFAFVTCFVVCKNWQNYLMLILTFLERDHVLRANCFAIKAFSKLFV